jgi:hypothetical protein
LKTQEDIYEAAIEKDQRWQVVILWFGFIGVVATGSNEALDAANSLLSKFFGKASSMEFLRWFPVVFCAVCVWAHCLGAHRLENRLFFSQQMRGQTFPGNIERLGVLWHILHRDFTLATHPMWSVSGMWLRLALRTVAVLAPAIVYGIMCSNIFSPSDLTNEYPKAGTEFIANHLGVWHAASLAVALLLGSAVLVYDVKSTGTLRAAIAHASDRQNQANQERQTTLGIGERDKCPTSESNDTSG